jgi:hypothetical protein
MISKTATNPVTCITLFLVNFSKKFPSAQILKKWLRRDRFVVRTCNPCLIFTQESWQCWEFCVLIFKIMLSRTILILRTQTDLDAWYSIKKIKIASNWESIHHIRLEISMIQHCVRYNLTCERIVWVRDWRQKNNTNQVTTPTTCMVGFH